MQSGKLTRRIKIQSNVLTSDGQAGNVETWNTEATVWASIEPLDGKEQYYAQQIDPDTNTKITIRHYAAMQHDWRIVEVVGGVDGDIYDIVDIINIKTARKTTEMKCKKLQHKQE